MDEFEHIEAARWVLPISDEPIEYGFIAHSKGIIQAVGKLEELSAERQNTLRPLADDRLIAPGFINAHAHLEQTFDDTIPLEDGESMGDWILKVIALNRENEENKADRCRKGIKEMIRSGVTCINDISSDGTSAYELKNAGLRGIVSLEFFHPEFETVNLMPLVSRFKALKEGLSDCECIQIGISPHSPYNVSPAAWQAAIEACQPSIVHTHLAESLDEIQWLKGAESSINRVHQTALGRTFKPQIEGLNPVEYLEKFDLLNTQLVAAHCNQLNTKNLNKLAYYDVGIAHCPRSNKALGHPPLELGNVFGIRLGLGTDGRLSTNNLDYRQEIRQARTINKMSDKFASHMYFTGGASLMGLDKTIGTLANGFKADYVTWKTTHTQSNPYVLLLDPETTYSSSRVNGINVGKTES